MQLALIVIIILCAIATFGLKWNDSEKPTTENWRWALRKRQIKRWFIYKAWQKYVPNLRWLGLLVVAGLTFLVVRKYLPNFDVNKISKLEHAPDATVMLALIGAPIAFIIWWFRDSNARQQIENQRKDVNLKDFQRLAEWAAGMHLPEDKVTNSEKNITLTGEDIKATATARKLTDHKTSTSVEINQSIETTVIPAGTIIHTPSRREGAASLQIAAIYQLQAFLQGDYGKYFQRPAFQLLKSIWLALVSQHLAELAVLMQAKRDFANKKEKDQFKKDLENWEAALASTMKAPIGQAITVALGAQQGQLLRTHKADLPNTTLAGYNSQLVALKQPLELDDLDLTGIQLQGANLREAQLQDADLSGAQLQGADLFWAELQDANLHGALLQGSDLNEALLQCADLHGGATARRRFKRGATARRGLKLHYH